MSFVYEARWFVLTQTEGEDVQPQVIPDWDAKRALAALAIDQIPFDSTDGNCLGFAASGRSRSTPWRSFRIRRYFTSWPTW